jgi:salicylate hydroxylase
MAAPAPTRKLRVAIIGGGLAGAMLANAVFQHPHLEVHIYESAPEFLERGAAVGLAANAQRALGEIIPSAQELLDRAGAVSQHSSRMLIVKIPTPDVFTVHGKNTRLTGD